MAANASTMNEGPVLYSAASIQDPYPAYAELRKAGPVVRAAGDWHATTYDAADAALRNSGMGRGEFDNTILQALGHGPLYESFRRWMLHLDPPHHTRLRSLVTRAFTPRAVESLRASVQRMVDELLDGMLAAGGGDFVADFAYPLPVQVICELLGVPSEHRTEFRDWSAAVGRALQMDAATPELIADGNAAVEGLDQYFRELIAERRASPSDTFLSYLIEAQGEGGRLTNEELLATTVLLFFAGHETTVNLLGNGMYWLTQYPDQWELTVENPDLVDGLVEEMLRFDTPVQRVTRIALQDTEIAGVKLKEGDVLRILLGSANRDETRFVDADRFVIDRTDQRHLAFSSGAHFCLGASLARMEARIAMAALAARAPKIRIANSQVIWRPNRLLRGLESLQVSV
jgi:cytochrome P450